MRAIALSKKGTGDLQREGVTEGEMGVRTLPCDIKRQLLSLKAGYKTG